MGLRRFCCFGFILLTFTRIKKSHTFDGCICLEQIAEELRLPTTLVNANDGTNRLFVAEQYGAVHVIYPDGTKLPVPFINMSSIIGLLHKTSEAGIYDIEFHPDFKSNRLFYMLFSIPAATDDMDHQSVLGEFRVSSTDRNKADPGYRELLRVPQPKFTHNVEKIAEELRLPTSLVNANDGTNRLFVAEQYGAVHVINPDGTKLPVPFINMSSIIGPLHKTSEAGICDIEFHPDFKSNRLFYMLFSIPAATDNMDHQSVLGEFSVSSTDSNKVDPGYRELLRVPQPIFSHNVEKLLFGVDGYLYVFVGDGGFQHDVYHYAQDASQLYGKVLRIDVDSRTGGLPYGIPADNPFTSNPNARPEIYAMGLRNPWRCGMDSGDRETGEGRGRIICGDTGQNYEEEVDLIEKGANYGWNRYEGMSMHCDVCELGPGKLVQPLFSYNRGQKMGTAAIGGEFYRGCLSPNLNGLYFWGDFTSGMMFSLLENKANGSWENKEVVTCQPSVCKAPLLSDYQPHITSFGKDENVPVFVVGEVYVLAVESRNSYKPTGNVYRIVDPAHYGDMETCTSVADQRTVKEKQELSPNVPDLLKSKVHSDDNADTAPHQEIVEKHKDKSQHDPLTVTSMTPSSENSAAALNPETSSNTESSNDKPPGNVNAHTESSAGEDASLHKGTPSQVTEIPKTTTAIVQEEKGDQDFSEKRIGNLKRKLAALIEKLKGRVGIPGPANQGTPSEVSETGKTTSAIDLEEEENQDLLKSTSSQVKEIPSTTTKIGQEIEEDQDFTESTPSHVTKIPKTTTAIVQEEKGDQDFSESTPSKVTVTHKTTTAISQKEEEDQDLSESKDSDEDDASAAFFRRFKLNFNQRITNRH